MWLGLQGCKDYSILMGLPHLSMRAKRNPCRCKWRFTCSLPLFGVLGSDCGPQSQRILGTFVGPRRSCGSAWNYLGWCSPQLTIPFFDIFSMMLHFLWVNIPYRSMFRFGSPQFECCWFRSRTVFDVTAAAHDWWIPVARSAWGQEEEEAGAKLAPEALFFLCQLDSKYHATQFLGNLDHMSLQDYWTILNNIEHMSHETMSIQLHFISGCSLFPKCGETAVSARPGPLDHRLTDGEVA